GVELPRTPAEQDFPHRRRVDGRVDEAEKIYHRLEVRRRRHDRADVEVAVRQTVDPDTDARGDRIVDGAVADRALDSDGTKRACAIVEEAHDAEHGILLQQLQRDRRIVEVDVAMQQRLQLLWRERVGIDLQAQI